MGEGGLSSQPHDIIIGFPLLPLAPLGVPMRLVAEERAIRLQMHPGGRRPNRVVSLVRGGKGLCRAPHRASWPGWAWMMGSLVRFVRSVCTQRRRLRVPATSHANRGSHRLSSMGAQWEMTGAQRSRPFSAPTYLAFMTGQSNRASESKCDGGQDTQGGWALGESSKPSPHPLPPACQPRLPVCPPAPSVRARPVPLHCRGSRACDKPCGRTLNWVDQCHPISLLGYADCPPPVLFVRYEVQVQSPSGSHNPHREIVPANSNFHSNSHRRASTSRDSPAGGKHGRADGHNSSPALVQSVTRSRAGEEEEEEEAWLST